MDFDTFGLWFYLWTRKESLACYFAERLNSVTESISADSQIFAKQTLLLDYFLVGSDQYVWACESVWKSY